MSPEISERSFEEAIECGLLQHGPEACAGDAPAVRETSPPYGDTPPGGYRKRQPEEYDRALCLLPRDVVDFVLATQPKELPVSEPVLVFTISPPVPPSVKLSFGVEVLS